MKQLIRGEVNKVSNILGAIFFCYGFIPIETSNVDQFLLQKLYDIDPIYFLCHFLFIFYSFPIHCLFISYSFRMHCLFISFSCSFTWVHFLWPEKFTKIPKSKDVGLDHWLHLLSFPFRSLHFISVNFLIMFWKTLEMKGAKMNR